VTEAEDLRLLAAADELTQRRRSVDAAAAWALIHGEAPRSADWPTLCTSVFRLEREGLVRSDAAMYLEVTNDGRAAVRPRNSE
jgi:hypothetical protein